MMRVSEMFGNLSTRRGQSTRSQEERELRSDAEHRKRNYEELQAPNEERSPGIQSPEFAICKSVSIEIISRDARSVEGGEAYGIRDDRDQ